MQNGTTMLFGLRGVSVQRVESDGDGGRVVHVVTDAETAGACPACGVFSTSVKQHATTAPKDLPYGEAGLSVRWAKTRWRCRESACTRATFTDCIAEVPAGMRTTGRLRRAIGAAVGDECRSVSEAGSSHGVTWPTAQRAVTVAAAAALTEPEPTTVLGIDETRRGKARWVFELDENTAVARWVRRDPFDTGFVDLAGSQGLLGQVEGRTSATVVGWLQARSEAFRAGVRFVAIDPHAGYAHAINTADLLPNAVVVVDHFHLVKLANDAVTKVRRRVTWEDHGRRGRKLDPPWANRRRLLTARERLSPKQFTTMWNGVTDADPSNQVLGAYIGKELLRDLLRLARTDASRHEISEALHRFNLWCADSNIAELVTLATTIETWWPATLAFLTTGITNARTEGLNRLVKQVKRSACGFRNPDNQRARVRFHCTRAHRERAVGQKSLPAQS